MRGFSDDRADTPHALGELVGTLSLVALLDDAAEAAGQAERLLSRCDDASPLQPGDARHGLHLRVRFGKLLHWMEELDLTPREAEVRDETARLIAFYLHMLTHALDARYSAGGRDRLAIRSRGPLTGAPCARLGVLRDRVSSWAR